MMTLYESYEALVQNLQGSAFAGAQLTEAQQALLRSANWHLANLRKLSEGASQAQLLAECLGSVLDDREKLEREMLEGAPYISLMLCGFEKVANYAADVACMLGHDLKGAV